MLNVNRACHTHGLSKEILNDLSAVQTDVFRSFSETILVFNHRQPAADQRSLRGLLTVTGTLTVTTICQQCYGALSDSRLVIISPCRNITETFCSVTVSVGYSGITVISY